MTDSNASSVCCVRSPRLSRPDVNNTSLDRQGDGYAKNRGSQHKGVNRMSDMLQLVVKLSEIQLVSCNLRCASY